MDWSSVTAEDLVDALREVDWSTPPRPVSEFLARFTAPRSYSKWTSRLKCNLYYYRTNYFILILLTLGMAFLWKPVAILAAFATGLSIAFLNDSLRGSFLVLFYLAYCNLLGTKGLVVFVLTVIVVVISVVAVSLCRAPLLSMRRLQGPLDSFFTTFSCKDEATHNVNQVKEEPFISVADLVGSLCCCFLQVSCVLWLTSCSLLTVLWALLIGLLGKANEELEISNLSTCHLQNT
ncbi:hypothetical protein ACP4OV_019708 [Aristida adscensionis]